MAKQKSWGFLNSLTHSGFAHVVRRHSADALEANYAEKEIIAAMNFVNGYAILSTIALAKIARNEQLLRNCHAKTKEYADLK